MKKKTGDTCEVSGRYRFGGYADGGGSSPRPTPEEMEIPMKLGKTFPPIRSTGRSAWWVYQG